MTELYLIAHKVRGEPAFDIATPMEMEGEEWWIIPTSGHRAYPFWTQRLAELVQNDISLAIESGLPICPADLPDHYTTRSSPTAPKLDPRDFLKSLGLTKTLEPMRRI